MDDRGDTRILRGQLAALRAAVERSERRPATGASRQLVQVFAQSSLPTHGDTFFACHPVDLTCVEAEGEPCTPVVRSGTTIYVDFLGTQAPASGDLAIATVAGGRWVADGSKKTTNDPRCPWLCGPIAIIDPPDGGGDTAQARVDCPTAGPIAGVELLYGGSTYQVAHPLVGIHGGAFGSGATATATVGEVLSLTLTDGGSGYSQSSPPAVAIAAPGGSGTTATATATVSSNGHVTGLTLATKGTLYAATNPAVTIAGPPGAGTTATATATAGAGQVTSLALTNSGSGYVPNTPPPSLIATISCPSWSFTVTLLPGGPAGVNLVQVPPRGAIVPCVYGAETTVTVPAAGDCPAIEGVALRVSAYLSQNWGWICTINWPNLHGDGSHSFPCGIIGGVGPKGIDLYCFQTAASSLAVFCPDAPYGINDPIVFSCSSYPLAWTTTVPVYAWQANPNYQCSTAWYVLMGGTCPGATEEVSEGLYPPINLTVTLSQTT